LLTKSKKHSFTEPGSPARDWWERTLAAQFETSLTAFREALIELEAHGFVTKKPECHHVS
jgi:hypothetical protein